MKSTLRQKRFRRFLFTEEELLNKSTEIASTIGELAQSWREKTWGEAELVAEYILRFLQVLRPRDYLGGPHGAALGAPWVDLNEQAALPPSIRVFELHSLRSCPLAVNRTLVAWGLGRYRLRLFDHIPDARTVLRYQADGERIVTCFFRPEELTCWVNGERDPLGFVLHDLIHADHFFRDSELARAQTRFYQGLLARFEAGEFDERLAADCGFAKKFEYLIADMNSHPVHLEKTLDAILR